MRLSQVPGPDSDAAAVCSAASVQSVSPPPVSKGKRKPGVRLRPQSGYPTGTGMGNWRAATAKDNQVGTIPDG